MCGSCSRPLVCPTRHDHGDREQSPGTRRTVPQADTCTATRHDLVRATSPAPGPHRPPSSARSPPVRPRRPLIQPAMRTVYSPHYLSSTPIMKQLPPPALPNAATRFSEGSSVIANPRQHAFQERFDLADLARATNAWMERGHERFVRAEGQDRLLVSDGELDLARGARPTRQGDDGRRRQNV